jgi:hypothetical protein
MVESISEYFFYHRLARGREAREFLQPQKFITGTGSRHTGSFILNLNPIIRPKGSFLKIA